MFRVSSDHPQRFYMTQAHTKHIHFTIHLCSYTHLSHKRLEDDLKKTASCCSRSGSTVSSVCVFVCIINKNRENVSELSGFEPCNDPPCSESLYRLSYPGSSSWCVWGKYLLFLSKDNYTIRTVSNCKAASGNHSKSDPADRRGGGRVTHRNVHCECTFWAGLTCAWF